MENTIAQISPEQINFLTELRKKYEKDGDQISDLMDSILHGPGLSLSNEEDKPNDEIVITVTPCKNSRFDELWWGGDLG
ncbi:MAG: hypothetical protein NTV62_03890 [Candidatus Gribaldobacteria bacterium]|nr:hypothetical protein [Candidatus Gribaldobacteria bacterium]